MAHISISLKSKKKEAEFAKRQAQARRRIEIARELSDLGLHPFRDSHLLTSASHHHFIENPL